MTTPTTAEAVSPRKAFRASRVMLIATTNPKKKGSESHRRFEGYFDPAINWETETVQSLLDRGMVRMDDIKHDSAHGSIAVGEEQIKAALAKIEQDKADALKAAEALIAASKKKANA